MIDYIFFIFGLTLLIEILLTLITHLRSLTQSSDVSKYGRNSWALITGSTDGIGKGFAISLAKKGFNIVQVSRSPEKLSALSSDLYSKYGIQVKNIPADFTKCTEDPKKFFTSIYEQTKDLDISILINNVGGAHNNKFLSHSQSFINLQLSLNTFPIVFLSRFYLKSLQARPQGSLIVNLSSVSAEMIMNRNVLYSATKSFDLVFSNILATELKNNTWVLGLQPGYVKTKMIKNVKNPMLAINVEDCSEGALKSAGIVNVTSGHWKHTFVLLLIKASKIFR